MACHCATVNRLKELANGDAASDPSLAGAAAVALDIINDVHGSAMTRQDIGYLHDLVDAIHREGTEEMLDHLLRDAPDCRVCAALSLRMLERSEKPE
jgi:hypothetical protein